MTPQIILGKLTPFENKKIKLVDDQSTGDIIEAILKAHKKYAADYDQFSSLFKGSTTKETARNIWNFLKTHIKYVIENSNMQSVKSPAAILAQGFGDCKHFSLMAAGILKSLHIPYAFRFASYRTFDKTPQHVFVVVNPNTDHEIWIDPVLSKFDYKKPFTYAKDKTMAVYSISGIGATKAQKQAVKDAKAAKKAAPKGAAKSTAKANLKAAKKAAGVTLGQKLAKGAKVVLKVAAAPVRNAFLLLVDLNFGGLATKIQKGWVKAPTKIQHFWEGAGGKMESLKKAFEKGAKKKRLLGFECENNCGGYCSKCSKMIGAAPAAAAAPAVAAPLLAKVATLLKSIGIDPAELVQIGKNAVNERAQQLAKKVLSPQAADTGENIQEADIATGTDQSTATALDKFAPATTTGKTNYLPLIIGGAAVLYFVTRKK
jgi:hypothetical protein